MENYDPVLTWFREKTLFRNFEGSDWNLRKDVEPRAEGYGNEPAPQAYRFEYTTGHCPIRTDRILQKFDAHHPRPCGMGNRTSENNHRKIKPVGLYLRFRSFLGYLKLCHRS